MLILQGGHLEQVVAPVAPELALHGGDHLVPVPPQEPHRAGVLRHLGGGEVGEEGGVGLGQRTTCSATLRLMNLVTARETRGAMEAGILGVGSLHGMAHLGMARGSRWSKVASSRRPRMSG